MLTYDVDTIVHEDLRSLASPGDEGTLPWELSSWARREIIENIEYRADCAGAAVERVYSRGRASRVPGVAHIVTPANRRPPERTVVGRALPV